jgi:hypothetical protein
MNERPIYSNAEILAELRREYSMRKGVYARYVDAGSMTQEVAHKRLQILDQVIQDYARKDGYADLFALRTAASVVAAEVHAMAIGHHPDAAITSIADRIARAMKEGR